VALREVHADAVVGARTRIAGVYLLAVWSCESAAALALVLLHSGVGVAHSLAGTIGVLAAIVGFGGHLQAYTLRAPQLGHHWRAGGEAKKGFILIKATRRLRTEDKKKAYNRPNGNHKQGKNGSPKAASSGTSWI